MADIRRLKATWIVDLINRYVPAAFTCYAAGIKTLKGYDQHRPDLGDRDLVATLGRFIETSGVGVRVV
ncbi:hypothetical protein QP923_08290 [Corynebacterium sp. MSK151]|uniref:hypothetical protein n=1 Tax=unclassified Corynebacterium TaxID=2624378 RepID=UPI00254E3395|nr:MULTISPECIES: hypothetical protein [unclassified Corynebacterium]MDK8759591.1 hypothetical protein [Corynebacterium sp. MSK151]MDK8848611.1 hypothetical protein [Corynebacterium sp. MSK047]